jgi:hypothetical protein
MAAEQSGGEQPNKPISNIVIVIGMSFFLPSFLFHLIILLITNY